MAGEYDNRQVNFDDKITVANAGGTQTAMAILKAAGYTGHPIARHFVMKHLGGDPARVGRNADVDATHGAEMNGGDIIERYNLDLNAFRIYVPSDTAFNFAVTSA